MGSKSFEQVTHLPITMFTIPHWAQGYCFEASGKLWLYQLASQQLKEVKVTVITDETALKQNGLVQRK
jgi:hypothetical protein